MKIMPISPVKANQTNLNQTQPVNLKSNEPTFGMKLVNETKLPPELITNLRTKLKPKCKYATITIKSNGVFGSLPAFHSIANDDIDIRRNVLNTADTIQKLYDITVNIKTKYGIDMFPMWSASGQFGPLNTIEGILKYSELFTQRAEFIAEKLSRISSPKRKFIILFSNFDFIDMKEVEIPPVLAIFDKTHKKPIQTLSINDKKFEDKVEEAIKNIS